MNKPFLTMRSVINAIISIFFLFSLLVLSDGEQHLSGDEHNLSNGGSSSTLSSNQEQMIDAVRSEVIDDIDHASMKPFLPFLVFYYRFIS